MSRNGFRAIVDLTQTRIEAFNESNGGGVSVRKVAKGYSLFLEGSGVPLARLRPLEKGSRYDILWWSHRERWEPVGKLGGVQLPLDEALEYIADDPMGCFWH